MSEENPQAIEKPWAVYGAWAGAIDIGRIMHLSENQKIGRIQYCEGQQYPLESWDMGWVESFKTSAEATDCFLKTQSPFWETQLSLRDITKMLRINFPTAMKQESLQIFHDTLIAYQNKISSQGLPKCTEKNNSRMGCFRQEKSC
jgi:hypothetical protein